MSDRAIGFIGQGWIGKNYADDFETRGYEVVRYALEEPYAKNKDKIAECGIVFVAVPTPTTPEGFDDSIVRSALANVRPGAIVVLKSTLLPGTTESLQKAFPELTIVCSPEFLREANAAYDAAHPVRNIIGIPENTPRYETAAKRVLEVLPEASYTRVMNAREAELTKYAGNVFLALKVVYANLLYDFAHALDADYEIVKEALAADSRIGPSHLSVLSASGHSSAPGRGAGGHCFIKDLAAFRELFATACAADEEGIALLDAIAGKNVALLRASGKDLDLIDGVYGPA